MYQGVARVPWLLCLSILSTAACLHAGARPEPQVQTGLNNKQDEGQAQSRPHARVWRGGDDRHHSTNCFPGHATVRLSDNSLKTVAELSIGDRVATADASGRVVFEPVYFFGHRQKDIMEPFVRVNLTTRSARESLELTPGHFVHSTPPGARSQWSERRWTLARFLAPGSTLWVRRGTALEAARVSSVEVVNRRGAFDPFTLGGDILVNGVLVSCHHNWVFDPLVPAALGHHMPVVYQKLMYPLRAIFELSESLALPALREAIAVLVRKSPILGFLSRLFPQNGQQRAEL